MMYICFFQPLQGKDEYLGTVECVPTVRLTNDDASARLQWFGVKRYGQYAGDLLAAFELFWVTINQYMYMYV